MVVIKDTSIMFKLEAVNAGASANRLTTFFDCLQDPSGNVKAERVDRSFTKFISVIFVGIALGASVTLVYPDGNTPFRC